jgi:hydroxyacylglutathione hydrolase
VSEIEVISTPALGDTSYLVISGDEAAVVDPQRDWQRVLAVCAARGASLRWVLETHVHNDYLTGALELRAAAGARIAGPASGRYAFDHLPLAEGDEIVVGDTTIVAMETPGHTREHTSYLLFDNTRMPPVAAFTGGSLTVGGAGRTDLLGDELAEWLSRAQFQSLRRLALLSDDTRVLPTHGAGSFCSTVAPGSESTSTVGHERRTNPALAVDEESFVRDRLSGSLPRPAYYQHMAMLNRAGPPVLGGLPSLVPLSAADVAQRMRDGGWVVDGRDRRAFAAAHLPGAVNIELDDAFATYVGWVVPFGAPLTLVLPEPATAAAVEAMTQLVRVGYEHVGGYLAGGVREWRTAGRPVRSYPVADVDALLRRGGAVRVLDVRQERELEHGRIPGSEHVFVADLPGRLPFIPRGQEVWTVCATGRRAALAASLLDRSGVPVTAVVKGGVLDWLALHSATSIGAVR